MAPQTPRFGALSPTFGAPLRRLKTVFTYSHHDHSDATSGTSTDTTSPLSRSSSPSLGSADFSPLSFTSYDGNSSRSSSHSHFRAGSPCSRKTTALLLRSKPSILDIEMAEERRSFGHELEMLEPRPAGFQVGLGIFEVLDGRA